VISRVLGWCAVALAVTLSASACSQVVAGHGTPAPTASGSSGPSPAPTATPSLSPAVKLLRGKIREAHRLAGFVNRPDVVFPTFTGSCQPSGTFYDVGSLSAFGGVFPDTANSIMSAGGYLTGYVQCRQLGTAQSLIAGAFLMRDQSSCNSSVSKLAKALQNKGATLRGNGGYANAYLVEMLNTKDYNDPTKKTNTVQRLVCDRQILDYVWSRAPVVKDARDRASALMYVQFDRSHHFQPTSTDKLPDLDDDPAGLRAKHAPLTGDLLKENGGYDLDSYLALSEDVKFERDLLTRDAFTEYFFEGATNKEGDRVVYRGIGLYKLGDETAAKDVVAQFEALDKRIHQGIKILTIEGIPGIFCYGYGDQYGYINQRCFFNKGDITVQIDVGNATRQFDDTTELTKLVKAQYGML
jgi:hypothetical protein